MKFKILHIISSLDVGGCENILFNLIKSEKSMQNILVISLNPGGFFKDELIKCGFKIISLDLKKNLFQGLFKSYKEIKKFKPDLIQGWMYHGNIFATFLSLITFQRSILIWNIRQTLYNINYESFSTRFAIFLGKLFSFLPKRILCNSELAIVHHKDYGFKDCFKLIENGVDTEKFYFDKQISNEFKKKLNIDKKNIVIGKIARFHKMKNHKFLIKNILKILEKYKNLTILLIGKNINYENKSIAVLIPGEFRKNFILIEETSEINNYLNAIDLLCLTSNSGEGMSNIIMEAMSVGVSCLSSDIGDNKKLLSSYGKLFTIDNDEEFINKISNFIESFKFPENKSNESRNFIISNYSLENMSNKYNKFYKEIYEYEENK